MYGSSTCVITQSVLVWLGGPVPCVASDFSDEGPCSPVVASCGCTDYYPDTMQGRGSGPMYYNIMHCVYMYVHAQGGFTVDSGVMHH